MTVGHVTAKVVVLGSVIAISAIALGRDDWRPNSVSHLVAAAAITFHGFFLGVLFVLGLPGTRQALLGLSLAMLAVGVAIHAWPATRSDLAATGVDTDPN